MAQREVKKLRLRCVQVMVVGFPTTMVVRPCYGSNAPAFGTSRPPYNVAPPEPRTRLRSPAPAGRGIGAVSNRRLTRFAHCPCAQAVPDNRPQVSVMPSEPGPERR